MSEIDYTVKRALFKEDQIKRWVRWPDARVSLEQINNAAKKEFPEVSESDLVVVYNGRVIIMQERF